MALWLEATSDSCIRNPDQTITRWIDASGNVNDALPRGSYAKPRYVASGIGQHGALEFKANAYPDDFTALMVPDSASLQFGNADFAYLAVMGWYNPEDPVVGSYNGTGVILGKQELVTGYPGVLLTANYPFVFSNARAATRLGVQLTIGGSFAMSYHDGFNDGKARLYVVRRKGEDFQLRINGSLEGGTAIAPTLDLSGKDSPLILGGNAGSPLNGYIAELIALSGPVSDADFESLEAFLVQKYDLR